MKVVLASNYFNHHQRPLCDALHRLTEGEFWFIATSRMREERRQLGYGEENLPDYVLHTDDALDRCQALIREADVVIAGSAPQTLLKPRIQEGKLLFRYSERPLKNGPEWKKYLPRLLRWHLWNPPGKPIYLLCASAYTAGDYGRFGLFRNRAYRWGYFPRTGNCPAGELLSRKSTRSILWAGRLLQWKHPEQAVEAARRLRDEGLDFELIIIGMGEMETRLQELIGLYDLADRVHLTGPMKPEQVRAHMEETGIFLFTSNRQEGWGAVLNESMGSGCAVVASHAIGSAPFLIRDGENGLLYESGNVDMLCEKLRFLLQQPMEQTRLGAAACKTITDEWNAGIAARRLLELADSILRGETSPERYLSGPCSKAIILRDDWFCNK